MNINLLIRGGQVKLEGRHRRWTPLALDRRQTGKMRVREQSLTYDRDRTMVMT
jgi:hypothetical protein